MYGGMAHGGRSNLVVVGACLVFLVAALVIGEGGIFRGYVQAASDHLVGRVAQSDPVYARAEVRVSLNPTDTHACTCLIM